ncbi:MAG: hypothetical protein IJG05_03480 [Solobacterium sp.]|nr:hypothetical protein [Solobacterium sp.]
MRCLWCGKEKGTALGEIFWEDDLLCSGCRRQWIRWKEVRRIHTVVPEILYRYNHMGSACLRQFKETGDEALKDVFLYRERNRLKRKYHGWTLLLMPSTPEKLQQRGFIHLEEMYGSLGLPMRDCFEKTAETEQKLLDYTERQSIGIRLKEAEFPERRVLVDDVITTGATLRSALSCIDRKKHRVRILSVFCVSGDTGIP